MAVQLGAGVELAVRPPETVTAQTLATVAAAAGVTGNRTFAADLPRLAERTAALIADLDTVRRPDSVADLTERHPDRWRAEVLDSRVAACVAGSRWRRPRSPSRTSLDECSQRAADVAAVRTQVHALGDVGVSVYS